MFTRVLTVCMGNVCRSPMAAALLADHFARRGVAATVASAGLHALVGRPAEPEAQSLLRARGIDLSGHRARQLTPELLRAFELVLVMEERQERAVHQLAPAARGRVHRIGKFGGFDVPDPYRRERAVFERALALIEEGLSDFEEAFWPVRH
ncbi:MAG TPA: low molecular weight protein-tyrosine-phosphatase [Anaeromyxobacter sp.]|nr:low molecular weight protein-tyrosine-phosphatase [Anaeromyxobacter sp.]